MGFHKPHFILLFAIFEINKLQKKTFITFVNKYGVKLGTTKKDGYYLHT
jgi:hypothetical protein